MASIRFFARVKTSVISQTRLKSELLVTKIALKKKKIKSQASIAKY